MIYHVCMYTSSKGFETIIYLNDDDGGDELLQGEATILNIDFLFVKVDL